MKLVVAVGVSLVVAVSFFVGICSADEMTPELAVLKGERVRVNRLAFSANGSRLAAAMNGWVDKNGKPVAVPGKAIVWDVDSQRQICVCNGPKADFTHVWMSADGKTVVTADNGLTNLNPVYHEWSALIAIGTRGYQAWDAMTGKAIGTVIAPQGTGSFTAAAVSPDGRYLAAVFNEILPGAASNPGSEYRPGRIDPSKPHVTGEVRVWDLPEKKLKWRLAGEPHTGPISWSDSVAFSPDATRLAVYRSLGDAVSAVPAPPSNDRGSNRFKPLKMLSLEPGSSTPTVTILEKGGIPLPARMEWPGDGGTLILRNIRAFDTFDPTTGRSKEVFKIPFPNSLTDPTGVTAQPPRESGTPPRTPGNFPQIGSRPPPTRFPSPRSSADENPGFGESQSTLSADGSRLAVYLVFVKSDAPDNNINAPGAKGVTENRVAIWDVGTRRPLGIIRLPDEPYSQREQFRRGNTENKAKDRPNALALSGDGKRLAVSDADGNVRVYDTTRLSGSKAVQANAPIKAPDNASSPQIAPIRIAFEDSLQRARHRLLDSFDQVIGQFERSTDNSDGKSGATTLAILKEEKLRFEKHGLIPWSEPMWKAVGEYLSSVAAARATVHAAISAADMPTELRDLVDRQVVAHWKHRPGNRKLAFYSSGKFGDLARNNSWSFADGHLTLHWQNDFVTQCTIAPDGKSYTGTNQQNGQVSGTYLNDDQ